MSLITLPYIFSVGTIIISSQVNSVNTTIFNDYNGNIADANISPTAGIEYTKLALSNSIKSTDLLSTTIIPISNGGSGTSSNANAANGIVVLNGSAQIPSTVSGALLTNIINSILSYGTNTSSSTSISNTNLKIAYGTTTGITSTGTFTVTNLLFTNSSSYIVTLGRQDVNTGNGAGIYVVNSSGSSFTITNNETNTHTMNWFAIGV